MLSRVTLLIPQSVAKAVFFSLVKKKRLNKKMHAIENGAPFSAHDSKRWVN